MSYLHTVIFFLTSLKKILSHYFKKILFHILFLVLLLKKFFFLYLFLFYSENIELRQHQKTLTSVN